MQPAHGLQGIDSDNYNNEIIAICHHTFSISVSQNNQCKCDIPSTHHTSLICITHTAPHFVIINEFHGVRLLMQIMWIFSPTGLCVCVCVWEYVCIRLWPSFVWLAFPLKRVNGMEVICYPELTIRGRTEGLNLKKKNRKEKTHQ